MQCTARIIRERKQLGRFPGEKATLTVQLYCPILGEIVLSGERAERAISNLKKNKTYQPKAGE